MAKPPFQLDPVTAVGFLGHTVLMELYWEDEGERRWRCYHVIGLVLPVPGVFEDGYFLTMPFEGGHEHPLEVHFHLIQAARVIHGRDRNATAKVLERLQLPQLIQAQQPTEGERHHG